MSKQISIFEEDDKKKLQAQINKYQLELDYDTRDYPISFITSLYEDGSIFAPSYQRQELQWDIYFKSRFVESLILDYPIPLIFLAENEDGRMEIVDGLQRISTISSYLSENNNFDLSKLSKVPLLNGKSFLEIPDAEQRRLKTKSLRIIVLKKTTPEEARRELFDRLNTSSLKAKPSEVRYGREENNELMKLISKLVENSDFKETTNLSSQLLNKKEDFELVARFFAYSHNLENFQGKVANFIDDFISDSKKTWSEMIENSYKEEFERTMKFVNQNFDRGFQKEDRNQTPHVRFEAIAVGSNLALLENADLEISKENVQKMLDSDDFKEWTTTDAANNKKKLFKRIHGVKEYLLSNSK